MWMRNYYNHVQRTLKRQKHKRDPCASVSLVAEMLASVPLAFGGVVSSHANRESKSGEYRTIIITFSETLKKTEHKRDACASVSLVHKC